MAAQAFGQQLHEVRDPVACRQLHQAEPVAMRVQAHRLGIDRDDGAEQQTLRQIVTMEMDGGVGLELRHRHGAASSP